MGAKVPQLTCCCGCTLRIGSLIIFWLYLISGILWMISPKIAGEYKTNSTVSIVGNTTSTSYSQNTIYGKVDTVDLTTFYPDFGWFAVVLGGISTFVAASGLYGTYKDRYVYLKPFLIWELLSILLVVIGCVYRMTERGFFLYPFFHVLFYGYFWLVIFSHYRVLKGTSNPTSA